MLHTDDAMSMAAECHAVNCLLLPVPRHLQRYQCPLLTPLNLYDGGGGGGVFYGRNERTNGMDF